MLTTIPPPRPKAFLNFAEMHQLRCRLEVSGLGCRNPLATDRWPAEAKQSLVWMVTLYSPADPSSAICGGKTEVSALQRMSINWHRVYRWPNLPLVSNAMVRTPVLYIARLNRSLFKLVLNILYSIEGWLSEHNFRVVFVRREWGIRL